MTQDVEVSVRPLYRRSDSSPRDNLFVWTYQVSITNHSDESIQLLNRYWKITDGDGQIQEVHGPGVVGERPIIEAGGSYEYTSFTHLPTSCGEMIGHYEMLAEGGRHFNAIIPHFELQLPVRLVAISHETPPLATEPEISI